MDGSRTRVLKEGVLQHQTLTSPVYDDVGNCVAPAEYAWEVRVGCIPLLILPNPTPTPSFLTQPP